MGPTLGRGTVGFGRSSARRGNDGNQVGAGVGRNVEDGVDRVGEEGEGVLRGEEPDKGHDCRGYKVSRAAQEKEHMMERGHVLRYWTFSSCKRPRAPPGARVPVFARARWVL